ncbi:MFS transporter [Glycomyces sp. L485]|uniref:MFS transporter n=1 Tax=Glycomyces sp. L485 TaxID=2909235 RepID=UPI001F4AB3D9|nr:MFS transporter [Glycomyces sp. L485]MCH7230178.1 MFS transporter [Glycomyces sp. L485]
MSVKALPVRLGLVANLGQFSLLVVVNALVGGLLGQERILTVFGEDVFGITSYTTALVFIAVFGATKAATNFFAGGLCDRYGRKPVLIAGWLVAIPVPLMLMFAPDWTWVIAANVLLGVNQGLTWSTTVIMKIDLAGPARRGMAMGLNEAAGYVAVAATSMATGWLAAEYGWQPGAFVLGAAYVAVALGLSVFAVRETTGHVHLEAKGHTGGEDGLSTRQVFARTSLTDPTLSAVSQAGLVNNLNDGLAWGLLPVLLAADGVSLADIGLIAAVYPAVWGFGQLATGPASDRLGRKQFIVWGMLVQATGLALFAAASGFAVWIAAAVLLGIGTAMVYPTLLAAIGDTVHPTWRARAVGVYRLWRDAGFAAGALMAGLLADVYGLETAFWAIALLTVASGLFAARRMRETLPGH